MSEEHSFPALAVQVSIEYYRQVGRQWVTDSTSIQAPGLMDQVNFNLELMNNPSEMIPYRVNNLLDLRYSDSIDSITSDELISATYDRFDDSAGELGRWQRRQRGSSLNWTQSSL